MIDLEKLKTLYKFGKELTLTDAQELFQSAKSESIKKKTILFHQGSKTQKYIIYVRDW